MLISVAAKRPSIKIIIITKLIGMVWWWHANTTGTHFMVTVIGSNLCVDKTKLLEYPQSYMTCVCDVYDGQETYFHHNNYQTRHNALACPLFCRNNVRMKDPVMSVCMCVCGNSNWHLARLKWWPTSTDVGRSDMDDGLRDSIYLLLTLPLFQCVMMTAAVLLFFWPA